MATESEFEDYIDCEAQAKALAKDREERRKFMQQDALNLRHKLKELERMLEAAIRDRDDLIKTFKHMHVCSQDGTDRCRKCGLDLRHGVHTRYKEVL